MMTDEKQTFIAMLNGVLDSLKRAGASDGFCVLARPTEAVTLLALQQSLRTLFGDDPQASWSPGGDLHVTLTYATGMGDVDAIARYLGTAKSATFPITVDRLGVFDTPDGKALYAAVRNEGELAGIQSAFAGVMQGHGYELSPYSEPTGYTPHITLGYVSKSVTLPEITPFTVMIGSIEVTNPDHLTVVSKSLYADPIIKRDEVTPVDADLDAIKTLSFGSEAKLNDVTGAVSGYLVLFGTPEQADFDGDFFTKDTDFDVDWVSPETHLEIKTLYDETYGAAEVLGVGGKATPYFNHGLDRVIGKHKLGGGRKGALTLTDKGVWIEARLKEGESYDQMVKDLMQARAKRGKSPGWSSGVPGHLVEKQRVKSASGVEANWIAKWPLGADASITHTPNDWRNTATLKSLSEYSQALAADEGRRHGDNEAREDAGNAEIPPETKAAPSIPDKDDDVTKQEKDRMIAVALSAVGDALGMKMTAEQMTSAQAQASTALEKAAPAAHGADCPPDDLDCADESVVKATLQSPEFVKTLAGIAASVSGLQEDAFRASVKAQAAFIKPEPQSKINGFQQKAAVISVGTKWQSLNAEDMAFAHWWMTQQHQSNPNVKGWAPDERFMRELADKATKSYEAGKYVHLDADENGLPLAMKMVNAIKSNELDSTAQSGFGSNWIADLWSSELWMRDRLANVVYSRFRPIDMPSNPYELPVETTDPTVYRVLETTDQSQLSAGASTPFSMSKVATSKNTITAYKIGLQTGYSAEMTEDSIIQFAPELRYQATWAMTNAIEYSLLQADNSATTTNLNKNGSSVGSSDLDFWNAGQHGVAYLPLNTDTTRAINLSNSSITIQKLRAMRAKFQAARIGQLQNFIYVTDPVTGIQLLNMDEVITVDKYGPQATVLVGEIGKIDSIPLLQSGNLGLGDTNGKINATAASNLYGRILLIHLPSYRVGYRRQVQMGVDYLRWRDAYVLTSTVRFGFVQRDTDASSMCYGIAV